VSATQAATGARDNNDFISKTIHFAFSLGFIRLIKKCFTTLWLTGLHSPVCRDLSDFESRTLSLRTKDPDQRIKIRLTKNQLLSLMQDSIRI